MNSASDRSTGPVESGGSKTPSSRGVELHLGDDTYCLPSAANSPRTYLTKQRLEQLQARLSPRDLAVLDSLKQFRLATIADLQRLHFHQHTSDDSASRTARRTLARLTEVDVVTRLQRRIGGFRSGSAGHIYTLTPTGHRVLGDAQRKRRHEPGAHHVAHTLAITDLASRLSELARGSSFEVSTMQSEPTCWRSTADNSLIVKPDLFVQLADETDELSWFIEIDRSTESSTVLKRKLATYTDYWNSGREQQTTGVFPKTLWIAPDTDRANFIRRAITEGDRIEPRLFTVTTADKALDILTQLT